MSSTSLSGVDPTPEPVINDTNRAFQHEDGDIILITSDNLRFKVHKYHLMAASPVFRDMLSLSGTREPVAEVSLTDPEIEASPVVSIFLHIIYGGTPVPFADINRFDDRMRPLHFVCFIQKYQCSAVECTIKMAFRQWLQDGLVYSYCCFLAGVQLRDTQLCAIAIQTADKIWNDQSTFPPAIDGSFASLYNSIETGVIGWTFDLSAAPVGYLRLIPDAWKSALLRASRAEIAACGAGQTLATDPAARKRVANAFLYLMNAYLKAEDSHHH